MWTLQFDGSRWDWDGAGYRRHDRLHLPFPDHDNALAASEDAWASRPERTDHLSDAAYQDAHDAWR
ncbi:hypothetical protein [Amycolatopsis kentuckyensis]|uniref:hypothetical protein n=1 Tax=Amycolatopsis kentuckyensis TaxID=218823 RepID=UPI000A3A1A18|nr:hypothetical protein [Amycolatopsis kentuckyensis]